MSGSRSDNAPWLGGVRRAVVVGLGRTGLSCARYLDRHGCQVTVVDSRRTPPELEGLRTAVPAARVRTGGFDPQAFDGADLVVVSPGVSLRALPRGVVGGATPVVGDIELFAQAATAPVAAVTGSNGKSTVASLLTAMAVEARRVTRAGANLGTPALELLDHGGEPDLYVLELSSFQLETTYSLRPAVACVLNVSADHMDRYPDLVAYAEAKARIYHGDGVMVLNADDPTVAAMAEPGRQRLWFTTGAPREDGLGVVDAGGEPWLASGERRLMPVHDLRLPGRHNLANALAALAMGEALGLEPAAMVRALERFPGLPHRTQWVAERQGVRWYDDSKATNVGATLAAVDGMPGPLVLIAGGDGKGADFAPLRPALARKARAVVLIGRDAGLIETALAGAVATERADDMRDAVARAAALAQPGDQVLLSPACASFDMFDDYRQRGEAFTAAARALP